MSKTQGKRSIKPVTPRMLAFGALALGLLFRGGGVEGSGRGAIAEVLIEVVPMTPVAEALTATFWARQWKGDGTEVVDHFPIQAPMSMAYKTAMGRPTEVWVTSDGGWSPTYLLAASEARSEQKIRLYPTATLRGKLSVSAGENLPPELTIRFEQAADTRAEVAIPRSTVSCGMEEGVFSCPVPASNLDLRLKAKGFVAHYRFGLRLEAGAVRELERGASVVGRVENGRNGNPLPGARIELVAEKMGRAASRAARQRQEQAVLSTEAGKDGFFQISGVPPGQYQVSAKKEKLGESGTRRIRVFEDKELTLTKALRVFPPAGLEVVLSNDTDPFGKPWRVSLQALGGRRAPRFALRRTAEPPYRWRVGNLPRGEYGLSVLDGMGSSWAFHRVTIAGEDVLQELAIDFVAIDGSVTLDGEPLQATLWFGGRSGARRLKLESDSEGKYSGLLPEAGRWPIDLESADPPISRRFREIEIPAPENGSTRFDFSLADLRLEGQIQDEDGNGLPGFVLVTRPEERPDQISADADGRFERRGLDAGTFSVQAFISGAAASSELRTVHLKEGKALDPLELVIEDSLVLEGKVISQWGGVAGAQVLAQALSQDKAANLIVPQDQTDVTGAFRLRLPAAVDSVVLMIAALGYGLTSRRVDPSTSQPLSIRVFRQAGTLFLKFGPETTLQDFDRKYWLSHNGNPLSFSLLYRWQQIYNDLDPSTEDQLRIPMLEFGEYALCRRGAESSKCQRDVLSPFGEISLMAR